MDILGSTIYLLCLVTSLACAALLIRAYRQRRTKLLLWSAACFALLAVNNLVMVLDLLVFTQIDLRIVRDLFSLLAAATLLYGFIWEADR
ncbi:MAG TPA: DUF5985 family protein [Rhizomicrobium sp.]|nr:DUF5985 family protein [Rhizomicrobium sp.]